MDVDRSAEVVLPVTGLTPYLRVRIGTTDTALTVEDGRSLFVFLPLPKRRLGIPLGDLTSTRVSRYVRFDGLVAIAAIVAGLVLVDVPILAAIPLVMFAVIQLPFLVTRAARIERNDGRSSTHVFCWRYGFDVSLALLDAEQRRDAAATIDRPGAEVGSALLS
jgi:hypothetical protein